MITIAKGKYKEWLKPDGLLLLRAWARDGISYEKIAKEKLHINPGTLFEWIKKYPEIADALSRGREPYDVEVENRMKDLCMGFSVTVREPVKIKFVRMEAGKGRIEEERIEYAEREVYIPPNVVAQKFWLANRKPNQWREKREVVADVTDACAKNMQTIANLINNPEPDIEIDETPEQNGSENE